MHMTICKTATNKTPLSRTTTMQNGTEELVGVRNRKTGKLDSLEFQASPRFHSN
jgi:hypothetical protein